MLETEGTSSADLSPTTVIVVATLAVGFLGGPLQRYTGLCGIDPALIVPALTAIRSGVPL